MTYKLVKNCEFCLTFHELNKLEQKFLNNVMSDDKWNNNNNEKWT